MKNQTNVIPSRCLSLTCLLLIATWLTVLAGCGDLNPGNAAVGQWGDLKGRTMVLESSGRIVIRDPVAERTLRGSFRYTAGTRDLVITLDEGRGTLTGRLMTRNRIEVGGNGGRPFIFRRRGT
jgi:hypothetical protein